MSDPEFLRVESKSTLFLRKTSNGIRILVCRDSYIWNLPFLGLTYLMKDRIGGFVASEGLLAEVLVGLRQTFHLGEP